MSPTRRDTIKAAGAASALTVLGGAATAQDSTEDGDGTDGEEPTNGVVAGGEGGVRVGHFVPDAPAVDIRLVPVEEEEAPMETDSPEETATAEGTETPTETDMPNGDGETSEQTVAEGIAFGEVGEYMTVGAGTYTLQIFASESADGTETDDSTETETDEDTNGGSGGDPVYEQEITVEETFYTAAVVGQLGEGTVEVLLLEDYDLAQVRLLHAVPDAPAVDVTVADANLTVFDDVAFGEATDYIGVVPGQYTLEVRADSPLNNGDVVGTFDVEVESGTAYSAYATGLLGDDSFDLVTSLDGVSAGGGDEPGDGEVPSDGDETPGGEETPDGETTPDDEETPGDNEMPGGGETPDSEMTPDDSGTSTDGGTPDGEGTATGDAGNESDDDISITPNF